MKKRSYEMMVIIDPDIPDEEIGNTIDTLKSIIEENGGELEKIDEWGKRQLAYPINKKNEGYYAVYYFIGEPSLPDALRKEFRFNKNLMRGMIIKRGDVK